MVKRFYKEKEMVWVVAEKTKAKVLSLDIPNLSARISIRQEDGSFIEKTVKFMEIDKLKEKKTATTKNVHTESEQLDTVLWARVRESAIIPTKNEEDAGYDIYPNFTEDELVLKRFEKNMIPTGIASSILSKYCFNLKNERGSTGKYLMLVLSGLIDSGYRGEWFVNICPLKKDIIISKTFNFPVKDGKPCPVELADKIYYPYNLAIAQARLEVVPKTKDKTISYNDLLKIPSKRGTGKLGSSNK